MRFIFTKTVFPHDLRILQTEYQEALVRVIRKQLIKLLLVKLACANYSVVVAITFLLILIEIWIGFHNAYLNKELMARIQEYLATLEKNYIRQWFASVQILLHE